MTANDAGRKDKQNSTFDRRRRQGFVGDESGKFKLLFSSPTNPFTILELQSPSCYIPELNKIHLSPDSEAVKLGNGPVRS